MREASSNSESKDDKGDDHPSTIVIASSKDNFTLDQVSKMNVFLVSLFSFIATVYE